MACIDYIREQGGIEYEFLVSLNRTDGGAIMAISCESRLRKEWRECKPEATSEFEVTEGDCFEITEDDRNYENAINALEQEKVEAIQRIETYMDERRCANMVEDFMDRWPFIGFDPLLASAFICFVILSIASICGAIIAAWKGL